MSMVRGDETPRAGFAFTRILPFPSAEDLVAFIQNTQNVSFDHIVLRKTPENYNMDLTKFVGDDFGVLPPTQMHAVKTLERAKKLLRIHRMLALRRPLPMVAPITPIARPPAPAPARLLASPAC
ncbi:hypothetical protein C8R44DRAFT_727003 [Mycena epipterygia]|nr:hypothetical protein C8R44DRAFT_727003 [Mycena epipterygia]